MNKPKIFVSFDFKNDRYYKYTLNMWNVNSNFEFTCNDTSPSEIQSWNIPTIKGVLSRKIKEATYNTLEEVYVNEGIDGLRNYQFLVPVYITDTGDIFGQADTVQGIKVDNHKFIVIQTFNLYDQLISYKPDFGDDDYLHRLNIRCDNILNSLYILGIVVCILIVFIILYFLSIYNALIEKNSQIHDIVKEIEEEKIKET